MKKFTFIVLLFLSSNWIFGQTATDDSKTTQAQVLKKCIDLDMLQRYFPKEADGSLKQVRINYYEPLLMATDLKVSKGGKNALFSRMSINPGENGEVYFCFRYFDINGNTSLVKFDFNYLENNTLKVIKIRLDLQKSGNNWNITNQEVIN